MQKLTIAAASIASVEAMWGSDAPALRGTKSASRQRAMNRGQNTLSPDIPVQINDEAVALEEARNIANIFSSQGGKEFQKGIQYEKDQIAEAVHGFESERKRDIANTINAYADGYWGNLFLKKEDREGLVKSAEESVDQGAGILDQIGATISHVAGDTAAPLVAMAGEYGTKALESTTQYMMQGQSADNAKKYTKLATMGAVIVDDRKNYYDNAGRLIKFEEQEATQDMNHALRDGQTTGEQQLKKFAADGSTLVKEEVHEALKNGSIDVQTLREKLWKLLDDDVVQVVQKDYEGVKQFAEEATAQVSDAIKKAQKSNMSVEDVANFVSASMAEVNNTLAKMAAVDHMRLSFLQNMEAWFGEYTGGRDSLIGLRTDEQIREDLKKECLANLNAHEQELLKKAEQSSTHRV